MFPSRGGKREITLAEPNLVPLTAVTNTEYGVLPMGSFRQTDMGAPSVVGVIRA